MRAILIINPVSGDAEPNSNKVDAIRTALAAAPFTLEVIETAQDRGADEIARQAVQEKVDVVIVGGGDGTVSEAAAQLVHTETTLGILPIGTYNNIARSLGILADLPAACEVIVQGAVRQVDIGQANGERYFFEAAGAGIDAALFPIGEEIKGGHWGRIFQAAKLTMQYETKPISVTFDRTLAEALPPEKARRLSARKRRRKAIFREPLLTVVANGPYYGGGYTVAPGARLTDGMLTVSIYRNFSKLELFRHFWSISRGRYHYHPKIETYSAAEVTLSSPVEMPVHVDGKPLGNLPVTLKSLPKALRVYAPVKETVGRDLQPSVALPVERISADHPTEQDHAG